MTLSNVAVTITLVLIFILIGGFFAAAEMAMVSLRESQIRRLSREEDAAARGCRSSPATPTASCPPSRSG